MRLIDADKLPYVNKVILVDKSDGDIVITIAKEYTSYVNDETPTVNAIPIEWFKKKIDWHLDNVIYGAEVYQWVLNRWYEDKENWEKENEID